MFRTTDIVLIAVMISAAAFTYKTKHEADNEMEHIHRLQAQISVEQDRIDVLNADWSLLRQPARLQKLIDIYKDELELVPVEAMQVMRIDDLPAPAVKMEDQPNKALGGIADSGQDPTVTGGIVQ